MMTKPREGGYCFIPCPYLVSENSSCGTITSRKARDIPAFVGKAEVRWTHLSKQKINYLFSRALSLSDIEPVLPKILAMTQMLVAVYFLHDTLTFPCFVLAHFVRYYFSDIWCRHGPPWLGGVWFVMTHFSSLPTLVDRGRSVR